MRDSRVRAKIKRDRKVNTFAELLHASTVLLENAKRKEDGCFYQTMGAILMSAFAFEAYLNHIGAALFRFWPEMERLPWRAKLKIVLCHVNLEVDHGSGPYQTLSKLFEFRNAVAHGRSEVLDPPERVETGDDREELRRRKPLTQWEQDCTIDFADRAHNDTEAMIRQIHAKAGRDEAELRRSGHSYAMRAVEELDGAP